MEHGIEEAIEVLWYVCAIFAVPTLITGVIGIFLDDKKGKRYEAHRNLLLAVLIILIVIGVLVLFRELFDFEGV